MKNSHDNKMKYSEELKSALLTLTDRYGITMTDVPDRFKEKLIQIVGSSHLAEVEHVFKPLELGYLRNLRIRATHKIEPAKLHETSNLLSTIEGFSHEDVLQSLQIWIEVFKVRTESSVEELERDDFFSAADPLESIEDVAPIIDNTSVTAPYDVERVVNQFDTDVPVDEPHVADYDGKFSDTSFETVADFKISEEESDLIDHLQSASTSEGYAADAHSIDLKNKEKEKQKARQKEKSRSKKHDAPVAYEPPAWEKSTTDGNVEDAFKALRDGKPSLASKVMMELARNGDVRAQFHLGEFYIEGTGIEKSTEKAKYWLRKASSRGSAPAKAKLEELENSENSGGCCGCMLTGFVVLIVLRLLGSLI